MDKVHCFLCNHCFNYGEKSWPLFDNDFKETTEVAEALVSMLSKILDFQLELNEQKNLHLLTVSNNAINKYIKSCYYIFIMLYLMLFFLHFL